MSSSTMHGERGPVTASGATDAGEAQASNAGPSNRRSTLRRIGGWTATPIRATGFWAAVVLPFLHVPLLASGLETPSETFVFLALLAANLVGLLVGRSHRRE